MGGEMRVLSLGWGVQSWTLAAMAALGEIESLDAAVFSDTSWERSWTYEFAREWAPWLMARGVRVVTVRALGSRGSLVVVDGKEVAIPAYTVGEGGARGRIRRQCTGHWKIAPLRRWLQSERGGVPVELWLGISTDEWRRAKDADVKYIEHRFPLLELGMSRMDCLLWLEAHGLPSPGKSSCVFCPFLSKAGWQQLRRCGGGDWAVAVAVDEEIRDVRLPGQLFVHPKCVPLAEAIVVEEEWGYSQLDLLANSDDDAECDSGHCFL